MQSTMSMVEKEEKALIETNELNCERKEEEEEKQMLLENINEEEEERICAKIREINTQRAAKWREKNREKYNKMQNDLYHKHKNEVIECEHCGKAIKRVNRFKHYKTKKCMAMRNELERMLQG